jgi:hypothetical protein
MSLLWKNAAVFQRESMAWHVAPGEENYAQSAKSVRHAGFAGYVGEDRDDEDDYGDEESHGHSGFDEDLYDSVRPSPTSAQERHNDEEGEYPQSYYDAHDEAYQHALDKRQHGDAVANQPDWTDNKLHRFVSNHGTNTHHWQQHATYGAVDLTKPVYATQSHVSQDHIDKYHHDPGAMSHHRSKYPNAGGSNYLGDGAPMFVTHQGDLHATEGHHRTAAALQRGDKSIMGWHYDADQHGFPDDDGHMPDHPDYEEPWS